MVNYHNYILKRNYLNTSPLFVLIDTNFIYFALKNKLDIFESFVKCLCTKTILCVSNCVISELEKLGPKFRLALKVMKDDRVIKLICNHKLNIVYADDCIIYNIKQNKNFIVATCDKDLKRRIKNTVKTLVISIKKKNLSISS